MTIQRIFYDSEFVEDSETIKPLSLGFYAPCYKCKGTGSFPKLTRQVCPACKAKGGRGLYVVIEDADRERADEWVKENVIPYLDVGPDGAMTIRCKQSEAAYEIMCWVASLGPTGNRIEFWAYFGDYDWVLFCQLFGTMSDLPAGMPQICLDLKQELMRRGYMKKSEIPDIESFGLQPHNAYADARWTAYVAEWLEKQ
jgi:hypothetical protein